MRATRIKSKPAGLVTTCWEVTTYDVGGNSTDGYEVNDCYRKPEVELQLHAVSHNVGTPQEFTSAHPTDKQIREVFGAWCRIDTYGNDLNIEVTRRSDGYPIGNMRCVSHDSLSPIRAKDVTVTEVTNG
jgi:hypothetical protein